MSTTVENAFLDTRRQFLRAAARTIKWAAALFTFFCTVALLIVPNIAMVVFLGMVIQVGLLNALAMRWANHRPIDQAVLPMVVSFLIAAIISWLFVPGYAVTSVQVIMLAVVLVSIGGSQQMTRIIAVAGAVLVMAMLGVSVSPWLLVESDASLMVIRALAGGVALAVLWQVADQYSAAQALALRETSQRALEAEAARAEAEAARAEAETRSAEQRRLLDLVQSLEVPIIPIGRDVLLAPLVGNFDARRIAASQRLLLDMVARQRAHTVICDVTGISVIDTDVARALIATAQSVRLLGAQTLISGISANIAQTLVSLGVGLDVVQTVGDLGQALDVARAASQLDR